jgi:hypothetical protein
MAAAGFGDASRFVPAVARHRGRWDVRGSGLRRLAWELQRRTSVEVVLDARPVDLGSPNLFEHPFVYLSSDGELPPLSATEIENLRRYVTLVDLLADANDGSDGAGFDASFRRRSNERCLRAPDRPSSTHVVFKSFFMLESAPGRLFTKPMLEVRLVNHRAGVLPQNDVLGALNRDESGSWESSRVPGTRQRELATAWRSM